MFYGLRSHTSLFDDLEALTFIHYDYDCYIEQMILAA